MVKSFQIGLERAAEFP